MNFWEVHGLFFCVALFFFPRLTMIFATPWGGILWWLGLILVPRITVAILGSYYYFDTNPFLCTFAWFWALAGENREKAGVNTIVINKRQLRTSENSTGDVVDVEAEIVE